MQRMIVKIYAVLIALLALGGLFVEGHMLGIMNADPALDWLRVGLALFLLYVGFVAEKAELLHAGLWVVGIMYTGMAIVGMIDPELWGVLPSGLTGFDAVFHLVSGVLAIVGAATYTNHDSAPA